MKYKFSLFTYHLSPFPIRYHPEKLNQFSFTIIFSDGGMTILSGAPSGDVCR